MLVLVLAGAAARGQELNPGTTFVDGQRITAAELMALVSGATVQTAFYTDKLTQTNIAPTDVLLVYSASSATFHKVSGAAAIFGNVALIANQVPYSSAFSTNSYAYLGYDAQNNTLFQIAGTNLFATASPYLNTALLNFSNVLAAYSPSLPAPFYPTNQLQFIVFDTNGVPHSLAFSNVITALAPSFGTNLNLPFQYQQTWAPWTVYGTNYGFTNSWGWQTNFPITSYYLTNTVQTNPTPTFSATDTIPINPSEQGTNTTVTIGALYAYFTNQNVTTVPAKVSFNGNPSYYLLFPASTNSNFIYFNTNAPFTVGGVYGVSFITNTTTLPFSTMQQNLMFYINMESYSTNQWKQASVFTTYSNAVFNTAPLAVNAGISTNSILVYMPTFGQYNADALPVVTTPYVNPNTTRTGVYDIYFRYPFTSAGYYLSGTALESSAGNGAYLSFTSDNKHGTNFVRIETLFNQGNPFVSGRLDVVINPP